MWFFLNESIREVTITLVPPFPLSGKVPTLLANVCLFW